MFAKSEMRQAVHIDRDFFFLSHECKRITLSSGKDFFILRSSKSLAWSLHPQTVKKKVKSLIVSFKQQTKL